MSGWVERLEFESICGCGQDKRCWDLEAENVYRTSLKYVFASDVGYHFNSIILHGSYTFRGFVAYLADTYTKVNERQFENLSMLDYFEVSLG